MGEITVQWKDNPWVMWITRQQNSNIWWNGPLFSFFRAFQPFAFSFYGGLLKEQDTRVRFAFFLSFLLFPLRGFIAFLGEWGRGLSFL